MEGWIIAAFFARIDRRDILDSSVGKEHMTDRAMSEYLERIEGDFITNDDGYEVFWPEGNHGYYDPFVLRAIADELDKRNGPWDDQINEYFENLGPIPTDVSFDEF